MAETIYKTSTTNAQTPVVVYSDLNGLRYESSPDSIVYNVGAVANHIMNLLLTDIGECDFEPLLGSDLPELKFSLPTDFTKWTANRFIMKTFTYWENDVIVNPSGTEIISYPDQAQYSLMLNVTIKSLNVSNIKITIEDVL